MKLKKTTAVILSVSILLGFAGCDKNKNAGKQIEDVLEDYEEALQDLDADGILDLTKWDDDDGNYREIEELLDIGSYGKNTQNCYRIIASSITLDYDTGDLDIDGNKATLKLRYELTDWESVFYADTYENYDEVNKALKASRDTERISGKLSFQLVNGEWKISRITALNQVFAFTYETPDFWTGPEPTDATTTTAETSETQPRTDDNSEYVEAGIHYLGTHSGSILGVESSFNTGACGVYDIDDNGFPEFYILSSDQSTEDGMAYNGNLTISTYDPYAKEFKEKITVRNMIYQAADGGLYIIAVTDKEIIISHRGGEESQYRITTEIYDFNWYNIANYTRMIYYDYDTEEYSYEYFQNGSFVLTEKEYNSVMTDYINRTRVVLDRNYTPQVGDIEFSLAGIPVVGMMYYEQAWDYVEDLKYTV